MKDVFISYSTKDQQWKDELCAFLDQHNISYWLDSIDLKLGQDIGENLKDSLRKARYTLMLVSSNSLHSSWVGMEAMFRLKEEYVTDERKLICIITDKTVFDIGFPIQLQKHVTAQLASLETHRTEMLTAGGDPEVYDIEIKRFRQVNISDLMIKVRNHLGVVLSDPTRKEKDLEKLLAILKPKVKEAEKTPESPPKKKEIIPKMDNSTINMEPPTILSPANIPQSLDRMLDEGIPAMREDETRGMDFEKQESEPPQKGNVLFKVPQKMQLQNLHYCVIRVANNRAALLENLSFPETEATIKDDIRIAKEMEVIFVPNDNFEVTAVNDAIQPVEDNDPTEWNFEVRPLALGKFPLTFRISAILPNGKKQVVLRQSVQVVTEAVPDATEFEVAVLEPGGEEVKVKPKVYNVPNIHKLLDEAMNDTELKTFCTLHFPKVAKDFTDGQKKSARVLELLEYAKRKLEMDRLLELMKAENPAAYAEYGPFY